MVSQDSRFRMPSIWCKQELASSLFRIAPKCSRSALANDASSSLVGASNGCGGRRAKPSCAAGPCRGSESFTRLQNKCQQPQADRTVMKERIGSSCDLPLLRGNLRQHRTEKLHSAGCLRRPKRSLPLQEGQGLSQMRRLSTNRQTSSNELAAV